MLYAPDIDPIAINVPPFHLPLIGTVHLEVRWYGLMYLFGFIMGWWLGGRRAARPGSGWDKNEIADLVFYVALGVIIGGRLGSVLFYNLDYYLRYPLQIFYIWQGGMSFHGGLIGVMAAMWWYGRKTRRSFFQVADFVAPLVPIGLGAGRIGNFINQELWGRVTTLPWGMVFRDAGPLPRQPSQLYEFALEGVVLFVILWKYAARPRPPGSVSGLFLMGYGLFRFLVEFVRQPDANLGYIAFGWMTMGQLLSLPMIPIGAFLMYWAYRQVRTVPGDPPKDPG